MDRDISRSPRRPGCVGRNIGPGDLEIEFSRAANKRDPSRDGARLQTSPKQPRAAALREKQGERGTRGRA